MRYRYLLLDYSSNQFSAMMWARVFYVNYFGGMTSSVLLGGLYLIWCDADIVTNSDEVYICEINQQVFLFIKIILDSSPDDHLHPFHQEHTT